jgi:hypothetical protein
MTERTAVTERMEILMDVVGKEMERASERKASLVKNEKGSGSGPSRPPNLDQEKTRSGERGLMVKGH